MGFVNQERGILLSIKPMFAEKIKIGEKIYEYRRKIPKRYFNYIEFYESNPIKKITLRCDLKEIYFDDLDTLFEKTKHCNGSIKKEYFDDYFKGLAKGYALELENVEILNEPINPYEIFKNFKPPQNFKYLG